MNNMIEIDETSANELKLYIENESCLYSTIKLIQKNTITKMCQKRFDKNKHPSMFSTLVELGAKKYHKEFGDSKSSWFYMFPISTRKKVAQLFSEEFIFCAEQGEYDEYKPKKYQTK